MAAVVLDHEEADQESGHRNRRQQCQPVADIQKKQQMNQHATKAAR